MNKSKDDDPKPELISELGEEILKRVKDTAKKIDERVKKASEESGEFATDETEEHIPIKPPDDKQE
jgi:hypothetical protein